MASHENISRQDAELMLYVAGELEPAQLASIQSRLRADPALQQRVAELQQVDAYLRTARADGASMAFVSERALRNSLAVVREQVMQRNHAAAARRVFRFPPYAAAAGIAIALTLGFITWLYTTSPVSQTPVPNGPIANNQRGSQFSPGPGPRTFSGGFGPIGVDQYGESSRQIDQELDALSMLSEIDDTEPN